MAFLFAAESFAFANFAASQGTITEFADLNYSIRTQAQQLKQHTISINLICKYQLHASITLLGGVGSKGEISRRNPQPAQNTKFCKCSPAFQTSSSRSASVPHLSFAKSPCGTF